MRKACSLTLLLAFLALPAWPSEGGRAAPRRPSQEPLEGVIISPRLLFRDIALSLRDGTVVRGRLSGATTRSVRLRQAGEDSDFAYEDIRKAAVRSESRLSKGVLPGVVLGLYAGNAALAVNTSRPGFYLSHIDQHEMTSWWLFFGEAVFAAIGGGIGWLVSSRSETAVFDFPADPDESRFVQERFIRFLGGEEAPSRVHLFIQNGQLIPGASGRFESSLLEAGFSPSYSNYHLKKFSLLRSVELSFSASSRLRAGLRLSFPSEPAFTTYENGDYETTYTRASQELRATAVHGVGSIELLGRKGPRALSLSVGVGAGAAFIRLQRYAWTSIWVPDPAPYGYYMEVSGRVDLRKTLPSGVAFGFFRLKVTPELSAGLAADFTFIPAVTVAAMPDNGVPGQKLGLSNASAGFVLGFHF